MLDPSTHANPLEPSVSRQDNHNGRAEGKKTNQQGTKKQSSKDVSKHTFYIVNSQMRLKLYARNEVGSPLTFYLLLVSFFFFPMLTSFLGMKRQMLQFITGLEKAAATSHYVGNNRFDSFAPIRLNVAAQWLVDGVSGFFDSNTPFASPISALSVDHLPSFISQRDYFWNLSRAMLLAKETIYIHDWWLSPGELFLPLS